MIVKPLILALGGWKLKDQEFKVILHKVYSSKPGPHETLISKGSKGKPK